MLFLCSKFTITCRKSLEFKGQYLIKGKPILSQSVHRIQFLVDCRRLSSLPHISFTIGHHEYKLTAEQYIVKVRIPGLPASLSPLPELGLEQAAARTRAFPSRSLLKTKPSA